MRIIRGIQETAKKVGIHPATLKRWIFKLEEKLLKEKALTKKNRLTYIEYKILDEDKLLSIISEEATKRTEKRR